MTQDQKQWGGGGKTVAKWDENQFEKTSQGAEKWL